MLVACTVALCVAILIPLVDACSVVTINHDIGMLDGKSWGRNSVCFLQRHPPEIQAATIHRPRGSIRSRREQGTWIVEAHAGTTVYAIESRTSIRMSRFQGVPIPSTGFAFVCTDIAENQMLTMSRFIVPETGLLQLSQGMGDGFVALAIIGAPNANVTLEGACEVMWPLESDLSLLVIGCSVLIPCILLKICLMFACREPKITAVQRPELANSAGSQSRLASSETSSGPIVDEIWGVSETEGNGDGIHDASMACSICLMQWEMGDVISVTQCSHSFHQRCVRDWLRRSKTCPMCRETVTSLVQAAWQNGVSPSSFNHRPRCSSSGLGHASLSLSTPCAIMPQVHTTEPGDLEDDVGPVASVYV